MKTKISCLLFALVFCLGLVSGNRIFAQTTLPVVVLHVTDSVATETPGNNGTFLFTRYGAVSNSLTVNFSIGGSASNGVDYATIPDSMTFPVGASNVSLVITPIDDTLVEPSETVLLTLKTNADYRIDGTGANLGAVVTILDNDNLPPRVQLFNPTNNSIFAVPTNILLQAEASDSDGSVRRVDFYRGTMLIGTVWGPSSNAVYSLIWSHPEPGSYVLTARAMDNWEARATSGPVNIVVTGTNPPPPPTVTIVATDPNAAETPPFSTVPINPGVFSVTRNPVSSQPLVVNYSIGGTASNGVDYTTLSGSITIASNAASAFIYVIPIDDTLVEDNETVVLSLRTNTAYLLGDAREATVKIEDNDHAPNPSPSVRILSPTNGMVFFAPTNIPIYATAEDSDGFVATVEFFAGTNSLGITTNNPVSGSPVNPFYVIWTNAPVGEHILTAIATDNSGLMATSAPVNISVRAQNVLPVVTVEATDPFAAETPAFSEIPINPGTFVVRRTPASASPLLVNYSLEGTASNGTDYGKTATSVTIPANESSARIEVVPIDDTLVEGTETVVLILRTNAAYVLGSVRQATVFIEDNDHVTNPAPSIHLTSPSNNSVFIAPANILITAEASDPNGQVVRVDFFAGDHLLGTDTNAPYEFLWTNVTAGFYTLTAKATDNDGAFVFASPVHITVRSPNEIAFVKRQLPLWYVPGVKLIVSLRAEPPVGTTSYSVLDTPPINWVVGAISGGGSSTAAGQVSFGPFNDGLSRTLTYEATPPSNETGEKHFVGTALANGITTPIGGVSSIRQAPSHPADNNPTNFVVSENELASYVAAWSRCERWPISPNPIPISYVTRAGYLFGSGGSYTLSSRYPTPFPPLLWVPLNGSNTGPGEPPWSTNGAGSALSDLPTNYFPGVPFTVTIAVTPGSNTLAYALEDRPPEGWAVTNVSDGGTFCPVTHKIRWGLFSDNAVRTITYQVIPRTNLTTRTAYFYGVASFNGINVPITGQRSTRYTPATVTEPPRLQSISVLSTGERLMTFQGAPGVCYTIETSPNFLDWTPLEELLNNDGALQYIDTAGENSEQRFYRVKPVE